MHPLLDQLELHEGKAGHDGEQHGSKMLTRVAGGRRLFPGPEMMETVMRRFAFVLLLAISACQNKIGDSNGGGGAVGGGGGGFTPATGVLDPSFNGTGFVVSSNIAGGLGSDYGRNVVIDSSGRVVVVGTSSNGLNQDMVVWRYNADGTLDTSFNGTGYSLQNGAAEGIGDDKGYGVLVDSGGRIVVVGSSSNGTDLDMCVWRFLAGGTLDTNFSTDGIFCHNSAAGGNAGDEGISAALDSSGRIVVTGYSTNAHRDRDLVVWRINDDGTLDTRFNTTGFWTMDDVAGGLGDDVGHSLIVDGGGRYVITGHSIGIYGDYDLIIVRLLSTALLDTNFKGAGIVVVDDIAGGLGSDHGFCVIEDASGRLVVTGSSVGIGETFDMVVLRYTSTGSLDATFNGSGIVVQRDTAAGAGPDAGFFVARYGTQVVVTGHSTSATSLDMVIWRISDDGTLDTTFGGTGFVTFDGAAGRADAGYGVAISSTGAIVVTGESNNGTDADMVIWRYI